MDKKAFDNVDFTYKCTSEKDSVCSNRMGENMFTILVNVYLKHITQSSGWSMF